MKKLLLLFLTTAGLVSSSALAQSPVPGLIHRYSFTSGTADSVGGANGALQGNALVTNGALVLDGVNSFLALPPNLFTNTSSATFETWVTDNGSGAWARIFDFGNDAVHYMFLSLPAGPGNLRAAYSTNGGGSAEEVLEWPGGRPAVGQQSHIVLVTDGTAHLGTLYVNGALVGSNTSMAFTPALIGPTANDWLGRSQYGADPYFLGTIDEFRIYNTPLSAATVAWDYQAGPDKFLVGPVYFVKQPQSANALQNRTVTFTADVDGTAPYALQWLRNGTALPGQTNLTLSFSAALSNDNATYQLRATNLYQSVQYSAASSNATLTVTADTTPPVLVSAQSVSTNGVSLLFSEPISAASATNTANYTLSGPGGGVSVSAAALDSSGTSVVLSTAPLLLGSNYTVVVSGLSDLAGNLIAPASQASFFVTSYILQDIGGPVLTGAFVAATNGLALTAGGSGIGGTADQFSLAFQSFTGNFDVQVRLASLGLSDAWATAGLMARDGAGSNAVFAASLATPGQSGCFFEARTAVGGATTQSGSYPVNYPNTWLRLKRSGNLFSGFASVDGLAWATLGSVTITASNTLEVGIALSSHNPAQATSVVFAGAGNVASATVADVPPPFEPPGPCSRHTGLVFSEIMYHPQNGTNNSLEFVEIYNTDLTYEDLSGCQLSGSINYTFPPGTILAAGGYLVVARFPATVQSYYGLSGVLGPFTNNLPNDSGSVILLNELGSVLLEVDYGSTSPWPVAANGAGHSLVLGHPSYGENDPRAWSSSDVVGGSPGGPESYGLEPLRGVVINEFLGNAAPLQEEAIELFNTTGRALNLSGCILSDDPNVNKYVIGAVTLPARGFVSFTQSQLGFGLNAAGGTIYLKNPDLTRVLDAVQFDAQESGVSFGRYPDGGDQWYRLSAPTLGASNAVPLFSLVGINEIMYKPISGSDDDQYVELYNRGSNAVDLSGWSFVSGISFTFPANTLIPAGGYLVVAANLTRIFADYPYLSATNTVGNFGGHLAHHGERLALAKPDTLVSTNSKGALVTNLVAITVDEVTYGIGGRWGQWADGGGSSLELIDPRSDKRLAPNWGDSDETGKAPWTLIQRTDIIDMGQTDDSGAVTAEGTPNRLEIILQGAGDCLVDDLEVRANGGANLLTNSGFESGTNGWVGQGTFHTSSLETNLAAFDGASSFHIRGTGGGDTGANRIRTAIPTLPVGGTNQATLRAHVRWLRGDTNFLMRIRGNWLECAGGMTVPANLGTPGLPNSRLVPNAGPAIFQVTHVPVLPAANEPVLVTAHVSDVDGVAGATLFYRLDPAASYTSVPMRDDGTGGDAFAHDGIFTATIPGQAAGQMVAFYVRAQDGSQRPATNSFPSDAPARECLVNFGETIQPANIGSYRLWLTQSNITYWGAREKNSNEGLDATCVYGNGRVIYNAQTEYSGSPFHTPAFNGPLGNFTCNYLLDPPEDDQFLGTTHVLLEGQSFTDASIFNNDGSAQAETTAYWMGRKIGLRYEYRRDVRVYMNGQQRGMIYYDYQKPRGELLDEYYPNDPNGHLYKIDDWFEFDDAGSTQTALTARLLENILNGQKRTERYRWNWIPSGGSPPNDFTDLYTLVDALNAPGPQPYYSAVLDLMDVRQCMRVWALEHMVADWDSWGYQRGKNMYFYKPTLGRWQMIIYDMQLDFGKSSLGTDDSLFDMASLTDTVQGGDPSVYRLLTNPPSAREYWGGFQDLVNGPMLPQNYGPLMDARVAALRANGVPVEDPATIKAWIAARHDFILAQIPQAPFTISGPVTSASNSFTLTGTAPIGVEQITVNGTSYQPVWTTVTNWSLTVPLAAPTNALSVQALDISNNVIAGGTLGLTVKYTGAAVSPVGNIVFNEIMHHPAVDGAQYVELFNNHSNYTFDLSNWRLDALSYTFPPGSLLLPRSFLVLAQNRFTYANTYGATAPLFDQFGGALNPDGATLTLVEPGTPDLVAAEVRYEAGAPWPTNANGGGVSLQLIDPQQDNWRVGNWATGQTNPPPAVPQWVEFSATGTASSSTIYIYLQSAGEVYVDDIKLVAGSVPDTGANVLPDGDFESGFPGPWVVSANLSGSALSTAIKHAGAASLHVVSTSAGTTRSSAIYQDISPILVAKATYTLSFWYLQSTNGGPLTVRLSGSGIVDTVNPAPPAVLPSLAFTPGASNSVATNLPAFPPLWINEVEPDNLTGLTNSAGQHAPWLELYNPGTNTVALTGLYLTGSYTNLANWAFPAGAAISPGQFLVVFADGQTNLSTLSQLHTGFALNGGAGSVALSRLFNGQPQVLDYVNYTNLPPNWSYGSLPDGQSFVRVQFFAPTPGASNNASGTPPSSFIAYNADGSIYTQSFDALPDPGSTSVNTANPVTINGVTYSLANPFDFDAPVAASGNTGGLGLAALAGWYGLADPTAKVGTRFGATDGDQTTGGQISFGLPNSANRALGLLATSTTGYTAVGAKFINNTGATMNFINLQVTGEVWRQSNIPKTLECYYLIDPTAIAPMSTQATASLPAFNVAFPTVSGDVGGVAVDGTAPANQIYLAVTNQPITNWPPGAAFWLVWEMADSTGKGQGLAIDNLSFAATALGTPTNTPVMNIQVSSAHQLVLSWPSPSPG
ncbi:MAG: lamin tail domain-containing protein, partial [Verrucomicrobiota bacterium]